MTTAANKRQQATAHRAHQANLQLRRPAGFQVGKVLARGRVVFVAAFAELTLSHPDSLCSDQHTNGHTNRHKWTQIDAVTRGLTIIWLLLQTNCSGSTCSLCLSPTGRHWTTLTGTGRHWSTLAPFKGAPKTTATTVRNSPTLSPLTTSLHQFKTDHSLAYK